MGTWHKPSFHAYSSIANANSRSAGFTLMSICFYFHPDGYTTAGRQVMGRHVAGESFLKAALEYGENPISGFKSRMKII